MELKNINILALLYTLIFLYLSYLFILSDHRNNYSLYIVFYFAVNYILLNLGNLVYIFKYSNRMIKRVWKIVYPLFIINLVASIMLDRNYGEYARREIDFALYVFAILIIGFLFLPSFVMNYKLAYK